MTPNLRRAGLLAPLPLLWLSGCLDTTTPIEPGLRGTGAPSVSISDVTTGGSDGFYILPPLATRMPAVEGSFDGMLDPEVRICELAGGACASTLAEFTTETGSGSETIRTAEGAMYVVNWHTNRFDLDPAKRYRIEIRLDGCTLGHADVAVVANARAAWDIDPARYVAVVRGQTVPVRFRIEQERADPCGGEFELVGRLTADGGILHVNPLDPVIASLVTDDGELLQYHAERDAAGTPQRVTGWGIFDLDDPGRQDLVRLDDRGRVERVALRDGSQVLLEYSSDTAARVTVMDTDGTSVVLNVDAAMAASLSGTSMGGAGARSRADSAAVMAFWEQQMGAPDAVGTQMLPASTPAGSVRAALRAGTDSYSVPVPNALVSGFWQVREGGDVVQLGQLRMGYTDGAGIYFADVPYESVSPTQDQIRDLCRLLDPLVTSVCAGVSITQPLLYLACALVPTRVPGPPGVRLAAICLAAVKAVVEGCKVTDACTLINRALDLVAKGERLDIHITASGPEFVEMTVGRMQTYSQPYPQRFDFDFLIGLIVSLYTVPHDPAPFQGYVATTEVRPAFEGLPVFTSMWGTDGYSQSGSGFTNTVGRFGMFVPGAYEGVTDVITTEVAGISKTTSIVF